MFTNPFTTVPPLPATTNTASSIYPNDNDDDDDEAAAGGGHKKTRSQAHAEAYTRAERAVSLAKMVDDELARFEAEAEEYDNDAYDPSSVTGAGMHPYAYAYGGHAGQDVIEEGDGDVGMAGRGAFGYNNHRM